MFTGIVQAIGRIETREARGGDMRLVIDTGALGLDDVREGDSIAVAGVCLTALDIDGTRFAADVSNETLSLTTLGALVVGAAVNLEKALRLNDRLGGHLVSGHVDGIARVVAVEGDARSQRWTFEVPPPLARYIAAKGSVCLDGVSLTVNTVHDARFSVNLIPHTQAVTSFGQRGIGDPVNLEVDLMARYAERLSAADRA
ncbi:MAG TPA: riboflavin synthase [Dokdonella sp.]|uniref:riboflavin synthase n=1 Tax=Dokdonella sp. TaxID=2291710 RepID=UPI0025C4B63E|nr:riboflavin synthase [Dokdonella sp.]MBX3692175.1 riboflavin synthase [Dokdonella sp.]HNR92611.1 riboflavin synthase [Dokdonella sp.]